MSSQTAIQRGLTRKVSKLSKGVASMVLQVVENMERETGIEPAPNSLEDCRSIENKQLLRPWRRILTIILQQVPRPYPPKNAIKVSNPRNDKTWSRWRSHRSFLCRFVWHRSRGVRVI
jgi:hypothetical protein